VESLLLKFKGITHIWVKYHSEDVDEYGPIVDEIELRFIVNTGLEMYYYKYFYSDTDIQEEKYFYLIDDKIISIDRITTLNFIVDYNNKNMRILYHRK
jgi:hypothetical protein